VNQKGLDLIVQHALAGTKQISYRRDDGQGGHCVLGLFDLGAQKHPGYYFDQHMAEYGIDLTDTLYQCPVEGCTTVDTERGILTHLNNSDIILNNHGFDFLTIARKWPAKGLQKAPVRS